MKIAIVTTGLLPVPATKGGAVENLIELFLEENERQQKMDVYVFSSYDQKAEYIANERYRHTKFVFIKTTGQFYKIADKFLIQVNKVFTIGRWFGHLCAYKIRKMKFDAVLVENFPFHCASLKRWVNVPILLHTHNRYIRIDYPQVKEFVENIDGIICVSDFIASEARYVNEQFGMSIPVVVAHNGINTQDFQRNYTDEQKIGIRKSLGIAENKKVVLFSGRFIPAKGVKELVEAFCLMPNKNDCVLLVIGASAFSSTTITPYMKEVSQIAQSIRDKVIFTGYVDYAKIPDYYAISDVQCVPSVWEEPACLVSLEGMAAGLAIVCSDSGGTPEHVNNDCAVVVARGNGYVERLSSALSQVLSDESLRRRMGEQGRRRSELFTSSSYYANMTKAISVWEK